MDLKQRFKELLNRNKDDDGCVDSSAITCSVEEFLGISEGDIKLFSRNSKDTVNDVRPDPLVDQEILDTIEAAFVDENCDGGRYQLNKLNSILDLNVIRGQRQILSAQLSAVSHKLFSIILQNQVACSEELGKVLDLQDKLDMALGTCGSGRLQLSRAKLNLTMASLGLLSHNRRRQHLLEIIKSLRAIHTLEQMGQRVQELLVEESYAAAIQLLVEGQHAAKTYKHFNCVAQLTSRLQDTLEIAEEQLDVGISKTCKKFDPVLYGKLQLAFTLLGKQAAALDQINLHIASGLHQQSFTLVKNYVELSVSASAQQDNVLQQSPKDYNKFQFQDLCKHVNSTLFIACLRDLCTCFWNVTLIYHKIFQWHMDHQNGNELDSLQQKLVHGKMRLWQDIQKKTRMYLLSSDLWHFSIDEFLHVLDIVDRLMEVGQQFCNAQSDILQEGVRQQSINYFRTFHRNRLDELRVFLEHESWTNCPVRSNFNVLQLGEFHFLQEMRQDTASDSLPKEQFYSITTGDCVSPFNQCGFGPTSEENIMARVKEASHDPDEAEDEDGPLLSNTTLSILRLFGRYVHFMHLLKTIAFDVLICLNQLFDFYIYSVYQFFGTNPSSACDNTLTPNLRAVLLRISASLICDQEPSAAAFARESDQVPCPQLTPSLQLDQTATLYGLDVRLVAAESVVFVAAQIELLQPTLLALIPVTKQSALHQFFSHTMAVAQDLRLPIYTSVACRCLDTDHIISLMSRVQWDIKEVMSQHSHYVDVILQSLKEFSLNIQRVCHNKTLPPEPYNILWDQILRLTYNTLLDGFSAARKCTNEGRALMQLDLRQLQLKMDSLTRLRPLPDASLVETYIKAYYLPESSLDEWVRQHTEYSPKQLISLLQCVSQANKKTRLSLATLMEELDLSRR